MSWLEGQLSSVIGALWIDRYDPETRRLLRSLLEGRRRLHARTLAEDILPPPYDTTGPSTWETVMPDGSL